MDVQDIHGRLRAAGRTLADLGDVLGLSHGQVSRLLRGKSRMRLDVMQKIEIYLAALEKSEPRGVKEERASYTPAPSPRIRGITLAEALAMKHNPPPRPSKEEQDRARAELRELSAALRAAPRLTDLTDDELLGYDET